METMEILKQCEIRGNIIKLPQGQLERKQYLEVKKKLELIGGKWKGGKIAGFVFEQDPTELLNQIANGIDRNLKKEFQFFETPELIADRLIDYANIQDNDLILEPSAGRGAIIKAINRVIPNKIIDCYELMELNTDFLDKIKTANLIGYNFLKSNLTNKYDKIIANPPFRNNQDIDHIRKMYNCLKDGGMLVTIASIHWKNSQNKKETEFRDWITEINGSIFPIEVGEFQKSGTKISTCIIILDKKFERRGLNLASNEGT